jgi:hypothetical protein
VTADGKQAKLTALAKDMKRNPIRYYRPNATATLFHEDTHKGRFLFGGNRSGKTYAVCAEGVMALTGMNSVYVNGADKYLKLLKADKGRGVRHWCVDIKRSAEKVLLPIYLELIPRHMLDESRGRNGYNKQEATLYLRNGSFLQFMSYTMAIIAAESISLHAVLVDEPPPVAIYDGQWARLWDTGGYMVGAMTPWEGCVPWPISYLERRVWRGEDGNHIKSWRVEIWENAERLDRESIEQRIKSMSKDEYNARILGHFGRLAGLVYSGFKRETHASYDKCDRNRLIWMAQRNYGDIYCGLDYGMRDPTACLWFYVNRTPLPELELAEGDVILFQEYRQPNRTVQQNGAAIKGMGAGMAVKTYYSDPSMWKDDPAGGLTIAGRLIRDSGLRLSRAVNRKEIGWAAVNALLAERPGTAHPWPRLRFVKDACRETVNEMLAYCWVPESMRTGKGGDKDSDVNDHCVDALRYFGASCPLTKLRTPPRNTHRGADPTTGMPLHMLSDAAAGAY